MKEVVPYIGTWIETNFANLFVLTANASYLI